MQQKNSCPWNHEQIETEQSVTALKCLTAKFFTSLSPNARKRSSLPQNGSPRVSHSTISRKSSLLDGEGHFSTLSILDHEDLLFLQEFQREDPRTQILTLTAQNHQINYTESVVINNDNTTLLNDESFIEESHPVVKSPPRSNIVIPVGLLKKQSEIKFDNGGVFKGQLRNGKMINGTFVLDSMFTYQGQLKNDKFHGKGTLTLANRHVITCSWDQGKPIGHVTIQYPLGQRYEGELQNFKKHGVGCLYFKDGSRYVGEFQNGQITGQGCYYSLTQTEKRGWWVNGEYQDQRQAPATETNSRKRENPHKKQRGRQFDQPRHRVRIN